MAGKLERLLWDVRVGEQRRSKLLLYEVPDAAALVFPFIRSLETCTVVQPIINYAGYRRSTSPFVLVFINIMIS